MPALNARTKCLHEKPSRKTSTYVPTNLPTYPVYQPTYSATQLPDSPNHLPTYLIYVFVWAWTCMTLFYIYIYIYIYIHIFIKLLYYSILLQWETNSNEKQCLWSHNFKMCASTWKWTFAHILKLWLHIYSSSKINKELHNGNINIIW